MINCTVKCKWIVLLSWIVVYPIFNFQLNAQEQLLVPVIPSGHSKLINAVEITKDGKFVLTASDDKTIKLWDAISGKEIQTYRGHKTGVLCIEVSNDGKTLVSGSKDGQVIVWNLETAKQIKIFPGDPEGVNSISLSVDAKKLFVTYDSGRGIIRDLGTGRKIKAHENQLGVENGYFLKDEKFVVFQEYNGIFMWNTETETTFEIHQDMKLMSQKTSAELTELSKVRLAKQDQLYYKELNRLFFVEKDTLKNDYFLKCLDPLQNIEIFNTRLKAIDAAILGVNMDSHSIDILSKVSKTEFALKKYSLVNGNLLLTLATDSVSSRIILENGNSYVYDGKLKNVVYIEDDRLVNVNLLNGKRLFQFIGQTETIGIAWMNPETNLLETNELIWDIKDLHGYNPNTDKRKDKAETDKNESFSWDLEITTSAISPNKNVFARGYSNKSIVFGNVKDEQSEKTLWGHSDKISALCFSADSKRLLSGAIELDNEIRLWDLETGSLMRKFKGHTSSILSISFLKDDKYFLSVSADETMKLWSIDNSTPILTYLKIGAEDWMVLDSNNYYSASFGAVKKMNFKQSISVFSFDQFDVRFNRPDQIIKIMNELFDNQDQTVVNSYYRAYRKRIDKLGIDTTAFQDGFSFPDARIVNKDQISYEQTNGKLILKISGADKTTPIDRFNIWINEVPIYGEKGYSLRSRKSNKLDTTITIQLSEGENRIETSVTNANAIESLRSPLYVKYTPPNAYISKTHFIGIGIDHFQEPDHDLSYSVKDVRDLANAMKAKLGDQLTIDTLFNQNVSISNVAALKKRLLETNINDKVIISYSGHGLLSKEYDYYLSSYTVNFQQPEIGGIPYEVLEDLLDSIPARQKLLLIDACHSGEVDKDDFREMAAVAGAKGLVKPKGAGAENTSTTNTVGLQNSFQLMQELFVNVQKGSGATIISAAAGDQFALEGGKLENGFFTYAILQFIANNQSVGINELKKYVYAEVERLSGGLQKPTSRIENLELDWRMW